jgi:hypothetical protein
MALTGTALQDAVVAASQMFGSFENRMSEYGVLQAFIDNAQLLFPANVLANMRKSPVQPVKIPMLQRGTAPEITARTCTITGQDPTSEFVTLIWGTTGFEIKIVKAKNAGNYIDDVSSFAMQMANGMRTVLAVLDTAGYNALESNKATGLVDTKLSGITNGAGYYQIQDAIKLYQALPSIMSLNDIPGQMLNIAAEQAKFSMLGMMTRGQNNDQNQAGLLGGLPLALGMKNYFSNRVLNGDGIVETHYLAPVGGIGMFTWNGYEAKNNTQTTTGKKFYTMDDPIMGLTWDVMEMSDCATDVNYQRVVADVYQFNIDFAFLTQYTSEDTDPAATKTPILKLQVPVAGGN